MYVTVPVDAAVRRATRVLWSLEWAPMVALIGSQSLWAAAARAVIAHAGWLVVATDIAWAIAMAAALAVATFAVAWIWSGNIDTVVICAGPDGMSWGPAGKENRQRLNRHEVAEVLCGRIARWSDLTVLSVRVDGRRWWQGKGWRLAAGDRAGLETAAAELKTALAWSPNKAADGTGGSLPLDAAPPTPAAVLLGGEDT
jgi:hypothetical protein